MSSAWEWFGLLVVFLIALYVYYTWNFGYWESQGVVGPRPRPVVGTMPWSGIVDQRSRVKEEVEKYGRVYGIFQGRDPALVVADPEILKQVLIREYPSFNLNRIVPGFPHQPVVRKFLGSLNGDDWRRIHHLMSPSFSSSKIRTMKKLFDTKTNILEKVLGKFADKQEEVDVTRLFDNLAMDVMAGSAFGCEVNCQEGATDNPLMYNADRILTHFSVWKMFLSGMFPALAAIIKPAILPQDSLDYFMKNLGEVIERRRNKSEHRNDLIQLLVDAEDEDITEQGKKTSLTNEEVVAQAILFLLAGSQTTSLTLSMMCYSLANNPDVQDKLCDVVDSIARENNNELPLDVVMNCEYLDMVLCEVLRIHSPAFQIEKCASRDCKLGDISLKKGTTIVVPIYVVHHDELVYPDPHAFDPERFTPENKTALKQTSAFIPFGDGPRACIGRRFAITEVKTTAARILLNFRVKTCSKTQVPDMQEVMDIIRPKNEVFLVFERRH